MKTKHMYKDLKSGVSYQGRYQPKYMRKPGSKNIVTFKKLFRLRVEKFLIWFDELYPLHHPKIFQSIFDFPQLLLQLSLTVRDLLLRSAQ